MTLQTDARGATMVEYLIVLAVVAVSALALWSVFGSSVASKLGEQRDDIAVMAASTGDPGGAGVTTGEVAVAEPAWAGGAGVTTSQIAAVEPAWAPAKTIRPAVVFDSRAASATRAESAAIAARITVARGTATAEDVARVRRALERLPSGVLQRLEDNGVQIVASRSSVTDAAPTLEPRRRDDPSWDEDDGVYLPASKQLIAVTTTGRNGERILTRGDDPSILYHEIGHALDATAESPSRKSADFVRAYNADRSDRAGTAASEHQQPIVARSEAYAETFSKYVTGDVAFRLEQPALWEYWNNDPLGTFGGGS